jgi:hypothetical protein
VGLGPPRDDHPPRDIGKGVRFVGSTKKPVRASYWLPFRPVLTEVYVSLNGCSLRTDLPRHYVTNDVKIMYCTLGVSTVMWMQWMELTSK